MKKVETPERVETRKINHFYEMREKVENKKIALNSRKLERALYLQKISIEKGFTKEQSYWLIAQIMQESGFNDNSIGDRGCSKGIIQWNECARGIIPTQDWKKQLQIFIDEIWKKYKKYGNFRRGQVGWNNPRAWRTGSYKTWYYYKTNKIYKLTIK